MIIKDLVSAYERLNNDSTCEIARDGFCFDRVSHYIVIDKNGDLTGIIDNASDTPENVPENAKKNTTEAWYLIDSFDYLLGLETSDGKWIEAKDKSGRSKFELFKKKHVTDDGKGYLDDIASDAAKAISTFLKNWIPSEQIQNINLFVKKNDMDVSRKFNGRCAFCIDNVTQKSYTDTAILEKWKKLCADKQASDLTAQCGITGRIGGIAKNHNPIKLAGPQGKDAYLISVDKGTKAYSSYNKEECFNSPVTESAMKDYSRALTYFYRKSSKNKTRFGNDTVIFWAEYDGDSYQDEFLSLLGMAATENEEEQVEEVVSSSLRQIRQGVNPNNFITPDDTKFHLLMIAPNAARLTIHRYYNTTFGELKGNVEQHNKDMQLSADSKQYPIWQILDATVSSVITKNRSDNVNPSYNGELLDSILNNSKYSYAIFTQMIARFKTDNNENDEDKKKAARIRSLQKKRISFIKAYLIRYDRSNNKKEDVTMALNKDNKDEAYLLGRLFAVMEKTQQDAIPGANSTIKDRFFASACSTPASVFPTLLIGYQNHVSKLDNGGIRYEKLTQEIIAELGDKFSKQLDLDSQGRFIIGYYQQRADLWTKKTTD